MAVSEGQADDSVHYFVDGVRLLPPRQIRSKAKPELRFAETQMVAFERYARARRQDAIGEEASCKWAIDADVLLASATRRSDLPADDGLA